jgi:hypothetical protein
MSETETPTTPSEESDKPKTRVVSYDRFLEVNETLKKERQSRAELEDRLEALESKDKSDVERLTRELEKAQKRAAEHEARAVELEAARAKDAKSSLVAAAAAKHKFHDPQLVAQIVDLADIEDMAAAEAVVKSVAKDRPYLVQQDPPERQRLRQVGVDGGTIDPEDQKRAGLVTQDEQVAMWGQEIQRALEAADAPGKTV